MMMTNNIHVVIAVQIFRGEGDNAIVLKKKLARLHQIIKQNKTLHINQI